MILNTICRCGLPPTTDGSCSTLPPTRRTEARWDGSCCLLPRSARYLLPHHCCLKLFTTKSKFSLCNSQYSCLAINPPIASATLAGAPLWQGLCRFGERPSTNLQEGPHCQLGPQQPCHPHNRNRSCVLPLTHLWSALHGLWTEDLDGRCLGQCDHQEFHGQWGTSRGRDAQPQRA